MRNGGIIKRKKFHINGRVSLVNSLLFGLGGLFCVRLITPFFCALLDALDENVLILIGSICLVVFLIDVVITITTLVQIKVMDRGFENQDATQEISLQVKKQISKNQTLARHLLHGFSSFDLKLVYIRDRLDEKEKQK